MGFKKVDPAPTFADFILKDSMDKNRCLTRLIDIAASIDWSSIESILWGTIKSVPADREPVYRHYCCSDAYSFKNVFISIQILNWNARFPQ